VKAGGLPKDTAQFLASGTVFGPRRVTEDEDGERYVVVPAALPDGGSVELWIAPELVPLLAAALAGRPVPSAELGAPQPRTYHRPGDKGAWALVDRSREVLRDPRDPAQDPAKGGVWDRAAVLADAAAADARWVDDGMRRRTRTVDGRTWVLTYQSDDAAAEGWYLSLSGGLVSVWMRTTSRADATERADERIAIAGGAL
jgi:hypothetical protein